jgi:hypothetical protein
MPERKIVIIHGDFNEPPDNFNKLFNEGFQLDRTIHGSGIVALENASIYHFIKYSPEEIAALQTVEEEKEKKISFKAVSMISVPLADVDAKLKEGYEIIPDKIYAKEAVLIKWPSDVGKKEGA